MADLEHDAIHRLQSQVRSVRGRFRGDEPAQPARQARSQSEPTSSPDLKAIGRIRTTLDEQAQRLSARTDALDTEARGFAIVERARAAEARQASPAAPEPAAPPPELGQIQFGQGHLSVVIANPPDFDEMTAGQRALATLAAVEGAAGIEYLGDNGWLRLVLRGSMTVEDVMRVLRGPLGGRLEIEYVSEEKRQIRLRYVSDSEKATDSSGFNNRWLRH